ncbi:MAG: hypothetical protein ACKOW5_05370 [Actinomycetales bacterium]
MAAAVGAAAVDAVELLSWGAQAAKATPAKSTSPALSTVAGFRELRCMMLLQVQRSSGNGRPLMR